VGLSEVTEAPAQLTRSCLNSRLLVGTALPHFQVAMATRCLATKNGARQIECDMVSGIEWILRPFFA